MTMLEKAARAAWSVNPLERGPFNEQQYEYIARAVLLAVREPDIGTTLLGMKSAEVLRSGTVSGSNALFTAMIDAILEDAK